MFTEFWQKKKHTIELIGILTAIGALFLNIPLPESEKARLALINIQFIWLFILTFSMALLCFNFFYLAINLEDSSKEKFKFDIPNTISALVFAISFWLIYSLWQYIIVLYIDQLQSLISRMTAAINAFMIVILLNIISIIYHKISRTNYLFFILSIIVVLFVSLIPAFWEQLANLEFKKWNFLSTLFFSILFNMGILLLISLGDFFFEKKYKKSLLIKW